MSLIEKLKEESQKIKELRKEYEKRETSMKKKYAKLVKNEAEIKSLLEEGAKIVSDYVRSPEFLGITKEPHFSWHTTLLAYDKNNNQCIKIEKFTHDMTHYTTRVSLYQKIEESQFKTMCTLENLEGITWSLFASVVGTPIAIAPAVIVAYKESKLYRNLKDPLREEDAVIKILKIYGLRGE